MTPEEISSLMAQYAAGSLTEADRRVLFMAAVKHRKVFNQLVREYESKGLHRLGAGAAAASPKGERFQGRHFNVPWWESSWPWGMFAAMITVMLIVLTPSTSIRRSGIGRVFERVAPPALLNLDYHYPTVNPLPPSGDRGGTVTGVSKDQPARVQTQPRAASRSPVRPAAGAARFALDYAVEPGGRLKITPAADGFLSAQAHSRGATSGLFSLLLTARVESGVPVFFDVPARADSLWISFSAGTGVPVHPPFLRDEPAGAVQDPNPSSNSYLDLIIRLKPIG